MKILLDSRTYKSIAMIQIISALFFFLISVPFCLLRFPLPIIGFSLLCIGIGQLAFSCFFIKKNAIYMKKKEHYPDQPWKWLENWDGEKIILKNKTLQLYSLSDSFILSVSSLSLVITFFLLGIEGAGKSYFFIFFICLIPAIYGIITFIIAVRKLKYGKSILRLRAFPGVIGEYLTGEVIVPAKLYHRGSFRLQLSNVERPQDKESQERILWEKTIVITEYNYDNLETTIPFEFSIP